MSGWFWRSAFGPRPFSGGNARRTNGSAAGVVTRSRKNASIPKSTASAVVARRGSVAVLRKATNVVVLRDHLRRAERPVRRERPLDDRARALAKQGRWRAAPDHRDARGPVADDEPQVPSRGVVAQRARLDLPTEARRLTRWDLPITRLARGQVVHGRAREVLGREGADDHGGPERRDQQDAPRPLVLPLNLPAAPRRLAQGWWTRS